MIFWPQKQWVSWEKKDCRSPLDFKVTRHKNFFSFVLDLRKESLYGDIPDLDIEKAMETARDREKWKKIRQSRRANLSME